MAMVRPARLCLKPHLAVIPAAIHNARPGTFQAVDCGTFTRKK